MRVSWSKCRTTASAAPTRPPDPASAGLADRVEALGGSLEVVSPAGAGTSLRAEIPGAVGVAPPGS